MNPNNGMPPWTDPRGRGDAGKRELPPAVRSRFTELFVSEPSDDADLIAIAETRLAPLDDLHRRTKARHERGVAPKVATDIDGVAWRAGAGAPAQE